MGWKYCLLFITVPLVDTRLMHFGFPETKGLPLEDIAALFGDEVCEPILAEDHLENVAST